MHSLFSLSVSLSVSLSLTHTHTHTHTHTYVHTQMYIYLIDLHEIPWSVISMLLGFRKCAEAPVG
jgi:hypothetical protein